MKSVRGFFLGLCVEDVQPILNDSALDIVRCAERLFSERGIDAVDYAAISSEMRAGIHDVECHFQTKMNLIDAVLARHAGPIQNAWWSKIETLKNTHSVSIRSLVEMMVFEIMKKLNDPDGGAAYVTIAAQLIGHPQYRLMDRPVATGPGSLRLFSELAALIDVPPQVVPLRAQRLVSTLYNSIAEYAKLNFVVPPDVYASDLVDTLIALVSADVSPDTIEFLEDGAF